jgi:rhodanese-related sulfurtransferase
MEAYCRRQYQKRRGGESGVGGDVQVESLSVEETWTRLRSDAGAVLIDVRTGAEWAFVGLPDLSSLGKRPVLVEWQGFPDGQPNPVFVDRVVQALAAIGANKDNELFFLCRSGGRSLSAARAMAAAGYARCRNVADGFEGPLDPNRHRGTLGGWKAKSLPWVQG